MALIQDSVRRIFHLRLDITRCPLFFNDNSLKSYLLHKLEEAGPERESEALFLTIGSISAFWPLRSMNSSTAASGGAADRRDIRRDSCRSCRTLHYGDERAAGLIEKISVEYEIELDFLPRDSCCFSMPG